MYAVPFFSPSHCIAVLTFTHFTVLMAFLAVQFTITAPCAFALSAWRRYSSARLPCHTLKPHVSAAASMPSALIIHHSRAIRFGRAVMWSCRALLAASLLARILLG